jgi:hypothetical protein
MQNVFFVARSFHPFYPFVRHPLSKLGANSRLQAVLLYLSALLVSRILHRKPYKFPVLSVSGQCERQDEFSFSFGGAAAYGYSLALPADNILPSQLRVNPLSPSAAFLINGIRRELPVVLAIFKQRRVPLQSQSLIPF